MSAAHLSAMSTESTMTPSAPAIADTLTAQDRCDRCTAQAKARALPPGASGVGSQLLFCTHHLRPNFAGLTKAGWRVFGLTGEPMTRLTGF